MRGFAGSCNRRAILVYQSCGDLPDRATVARFLFTSHARICRIVQPSRDSYLPVMRGFAGSCNRRAILIYQSCEDLPDRATVARFLFTSHARICRIVQPSRDSYLPVMRGFAGSCNRRAILIYQSCEDLPDRATVARFLFTSHARICRIVQPSRDSCLPVMWGFAGSCNRRAILFTSHARICRIVQPSRDSYLPVMRGFAGSCNRRAILIYQSCEDLPDRATVARFLFTSHARICRIVQPSRDSYLPVMRGFAGSCNRRQILAWLVNRIAQRLHDPATPMTGKQNRATVARSGKSPHDW